MMLLLDTSETWWGKQEEPEKGFCLGTLVLYGLISSPSLLLSWTGSNNKKNQLQFNLS